MSVMSYAPCLVAARSLNVTTFTVLHVAVLLNVILPCLSCLDVATSKAMHVPCLVAACSLYVTTFSVLWLHVLYMTVLWLFS